MLVLCFWVCEKGKVDGNCRGTGWWWKRQGEGGRKNWQIT